jgi:flagellar basal-body rod modification protein FlgD
MNIQGILPMITAPMTAQNAQSVKSRSMSSTTGSSSTTGASSTSGSSSTSSGPGGLSSTQLESTFLNLLATELQNQDPTSPVDPTQMVGQLVSLNQLDQLISINSTLSNLGGSGSSTTGASGTTPASQSTAAVASGASGIGSASTNTQATHIPSVSAMQTQLQSAYSNAAGTNALMNLYGSFTAPAQTQQFSTTGGR